MPNIDTNIIEEARNLIKHLKEENNILRGQIRIVNIFEMALSGNRPEHYGAEVDFDWRLKKYIEHLESLDAKKINSPIPENGIPKVDSAARFFVKDEDN